MRELGKVPVGISGRHIHVSREDLETLFGEGYELTPLKELSQPGQFAAEEVVTLVGPKGVLQKVRILGPVRGSTQVEISRTDGFTLGIRPPVRESGDIEGSASVTVVGPKGSITLKEGVIVASRHIHMSPDHAAKMGLKDKDTVDVRVDGDRALTFNNVWIRVREDFALDFHVDTDEANAAGLNNQDMVTVLKAD